MVGSAHGQLTFERSHRLARGKAFESLGAQAKRMLPEQRIAEALGVSKGAVSQWMKRARQGGGAQALRRQPAPGASPRLSEEQRTKLPELLERGAEAHGFRGEAWTCERVAIVIRREFGVSYHPAHVSRLLKAFRHSLQKPQRRANQRDEEAIERWKDERWPSLKKGR
jgi:transposase